MRINRVKGGFTLYLIISIILSTILGFSFLFMGNLGFFLAFGIVAGSLFRGLYILNDIHKRLSKDEQKDEAKEAYEKHLNEKEDIDQG